MDAIRFAFAFLMFHRRTITGILLLIGLYFFFTDILPQIPKWNLNPRQKLTDVENSDDDAETGVESPTQPREGMGKSTDQIVKSTDLVELFDELIRLKDLSSKAPNEGASLVIAGDIGKIAKRILELPVSSDQRRFALGAFTESLFLMRLVNVNSKLADESIDAQFLAVTKEFLNDPDPKISSYAAVTILASFVFELQANESAENLNQLDEAIHEHFENLVKLPVQLDRVCELLLQSNIAMSEKISTADFLTRFTQRLKNHGNEQVRDIGKTFVENLEFRKLDIGNIVFKLGARSPASDLMADQYFQKLEEFPDVSISVFQVGMDIIREYLIQGKRKRAAELVELVDSRILPNRIDKDSRVRIQKALDELKYVTQPNAPKR